MYTDTSGIEIRFATPTGTTHGHLSLPPTGQGPGVVVIQEWWGLTSHIVSVTDRLAAEGFVALAPNLYGQPATHRADEAERMMKAMPLAAGVERLAGAVDHLAARPEVTGSALAAVGFCMGGAFVLALAAARPQLVRTAVAYYPAFTHGDLALEGITATVQAHIANADEFLPVGEARRLEQRLRDGGAAVEFHYHEAGHAFLNEENLLGTYDAAVAELAWSQTVAKLHAELGGG